MNEYVSFFIVFALALTVSAGLVPVAVALGKRFNIVSRFGGRRTSEGDVRKVSKLGSVALFGGFTVAAVAAQFLPVPRLDGMEIVRLTGLLLGGAVIFIAGLLDDKYDLAPLPQFIAQSVAAGIAIAFQIFIEYVNNPLTGTQTEAFPYIITVTISYFWLVGMMNTVNFLDGADGLAGGVAVIAAAVLFINGAFRLDPPQTSVSLLHLALMGAALGFLLYNFYPARIFMGSGAVYLGYILGALAIIGGAKMATILLVMGLPLLDSVWQVFNRVRQGRNPMSGDRGHLHFRLIDLGISQRQLVIGYYVFCAIFGGLTLFTDSRLFKFIAIGVMGLLVVIAFVIVIRYRRSSSVSASASVSSVSDSSLSASANSSTTVSETASSLSSSSGAEAKPLTEEV